MGIAERDSDPAAFVELADQRLYGDSLIQWNPRFISENPETDHDGSKNQADRAPVRA